MRPKSEVKDIQLDLFKVDLERLIDPRNGLVILSQKIDWKGFDDLFGNTFDPKNGRPGISTRLMVGLHYLKYTYNLSDADVVSCWVENPYWQYFTGGLFFEHEFPIDSSSMTNWRKRIGSSGAEKLLSETILTGVTTGIIKKKELSKANADTTVQTKAIRYPTDSRLYNRMREKLVKEAENLGIRLRQNYNKIGKVLLHRQQNYSHAKQFNRARKETSKLKTILGRVVRDIERKFTGTMSEKIEKLLNLAKRLYVQQKNGKSKIYSVHEPDVECISKGKFPNRYEFGNKVGIITTAETNWILGSYAFKGSPYDGHTLSEMISQAENNTGIKISQVTCDLGYRGHDYKGNAEVLIVPRNKRGKPKRLRHYWRRRSAIEPIIGHQKSDHRLERNMLKGTEGNSFNAIMAACGFNMRKLIAILFTFLFFARNVLKITGIFQANKEYNYLSV